MNPTCGGHIRVALLMSLDASNVRQGYGCMLDFVFCILACAPEV